MSKAPKTLVDTLPVYLRRACSCMSADGGFSAWLDARYGAGKWMHGDYPRDGFDVAITGRELADLAVEYGHQQLSKLFSGDLREALSGMLDAHGGLCRSPSAQRAQAALEAAE